mmetsp:Transcript_15421/g.33972  ORF Transcript_15421/g.33972 Transcript_15421/m.33972 type:complete len:355 (+) Transcript_15421:209-1273(+)
MLGLGSWVLGPQPLAAPQPPIPPASQLLNVSANSCESPNSPAIEEAVLQLDLWSVNGKGRKLLPRPLELLTEALGRELQGNAWRRQRLLHGVPDGRQVSGVLALAVEHMAPVLPKLLEHRRHLELHLAPEALVEVVQELPTVGLGVLHLHPLGEEGLLTLQGRLEVDAIHALRLAPDGALHHARVFLGELRKQVDQTVGRLFSIDDLVAEHAAHAHQLLLLNSETLAKAEGDVARTVKELQLRILVATNLVPGELLCGASPAGPLCHLATRKPVDQGRLADVWKAEHDGTDGTRIHALASPPPVHVGPGFHKFQSQRLYGFAAPLRIHGYHWHSAVTFRLADVCHGLLQSCTRH